MLPPENYIGREQTYLKHLFLENYLERVAWNIFSFRNDFVYVDGFSGPWSSKDELYNDTSFMIALNKLRYVRDSLREKYNKNVSVRCIFVENDEQAFKELQEVVSSISDIDITPLYNDFEYVIDDIVKDVGSSFSLTFIDPTGWTGFGLKKIEPLLKLRGEVLINFMYDFVSRSLEDPRPETARSFDMLYGGVHWEDTVSQFIHLGMSREDAIIEVYRQNVRLFGGFKFITSTRILKPLADRSYFHLIYATRSWKGILEFRSVEKKSLDQQERIRAGAKYFDQVSRTRQSDLFGEQSKIGSSLYQEERAKNLKFAKDIFLKIIYKNVRIKYEDLIGSVLQTPLVWKSDVDLWIKELRDYILDTCSLLSYIDR